MDLYIEPMITIGVYFIHNYNYLNMCLHTL